MTEGVQHKPTHDALQYLLNHQDALQRYCEDGRLPMTNIQAEHVAKSIALARKNFLFADTPAGAKTSAMTNSLLETLIHPNAQIEQLTPRLWKRGSSIFLKIRCQSDLMLRD